MSRMLLVLNMPEALDDLVMGVIEVVKPSDLANVLGTPRLKEAVLSSTPFALVLETDEDFRLARDRLMCETSIHLLMEDARET
jgi:hypothetical protein